MKIFLLGQNGYVGGWILRHFSALEGVEVVPVQVDVTDRSAVIEALKDARDAVVINATGKTGKPNVDWCEDHRLETAKVNVDGAINVCEVASDQGNYVIQVGSGCIFTGDDSYLFTEDDEPNFFGSYYSQTKAVAESALKEISNVCVLRIRMPIEGSETSKNLLNKLLKYEKVISVPNSVTVMEDFMPFIERVIEKRVVGSLNSVNLGVYEHRDLLELYRKIVDPQRSFEYIGLDEFEGMTVAKRSNCVLSTKKCEDLGIAMPHFKDSLPRVLEAYRQQKV
ncbi:MAG: sugar nucleotide-binding protein [Candidatus Gracilibacteria bacterium]|nr:sugar nucleotide-binding protein [Candidatus Gracilibacteria bacterium]